MNTNNQKIHFIYAIFFLILIIIFLAASLFIQNGKSALSHLNVAATIISITLGFLAIIYAYISNNSFSQSYEKINKATVEISKASQDLSDSGKNLNDISHKTNDLREKIDQISELINGFSLKIDEITPKISSTSLFIEQKFPLEMENLKNSIQHSNNGKSHSKNTEMFIPKTSEWSFFTLIFLICLKLSYENKKEVDFLKIVNEKTKEIGYTEQLQSFYFGIIQILVSTNMIEIDEDLYSNNENSLIRALNFRKEWDDCEQVFEEKIKKRQKENIITMYISLKNSVVDYFKNQN